VSLRDILTRPRPYPVEYGQPEQGYLAPPPPADSLLHGIVILVLTMGLQTLARAAGFTALWRHYLPGWVYLLVLGALGLSILLFEKLRRRRGAASRRDFIIAGAVTVLFGALLLDSHLPE